MVNDLYLRYLESKKFILEDCGFTVDDGLINPMLYDFQRDIVSWALRKGRSAVFADCGLGKTPIQLEWAKFVVLETNKPVLIVAPLAVSQQTKVEGIKFGVDVNICEGADDLVLGVNITNYEKLHKFDGGGLGGVVLDESSILKNFTGVTRNRIINMFESVPYKLACTATPAPNDYIELGNHSEFLGVRTRQEMLSMFFINDSGRTGRWRLKGHVEDNVFWEWLASWAVVMTKPSDLGYEDDDFILPGIRYFEHFVKCGKIPKNGFFVKEATDLLDRRRIRKESLVDRCKLAADIINATDDIWVIWCGLNAEGDYLEKIVDGSVQVAGRHDDQLKADRMVNFSLGNIKRLITKPSIGGLGMNWQVCSKAAFVGLSDSWEQFYQAVRRIWRFGQKKPVEIHIFLEEREGSVLRNVMKKEKRALEMIRNTVNFCSRFIRSEVCGGGMGVTDKYEARMKMEVPSWLMK